MGQGGHPVVGPRGSRPRRAWTRHKVRARSRRTDDPARVTPSCSTRRLRRRHPVPGENRRSAYEDHVAVGTVRRGRGFTQWTGRRSGSVVGTRKPACASQRSLPESASEQIHVALHLSVVPVANGRTARIPVTKGLTACGGAGRRHRDTEAATAVTGTPHAPRIALTGSPADGQHLLENASSPDQPPAACSHRPGTTAESSAPRATPQISVSSLHAECPAKRHWTLSGRNQSLHAGSQAPRPPEHHAPRWCGAARPGVRAPGASPDSRGGPCSLAWCGGRQ